MHIRCAALVTKRLASPARTNPSPCPTRTPFHRYLLSICGDTTPQPILQAPSPLFHVVIIHICPDPTLQHFHVLSAIEWYHIRFHTSQRATARHEGAKPPFVDDPVSACRSRRFEILVMDMMKTRLTCTDISRPVRPRGLLLHRVLVLFRCNCKLRNFF